MNKLSIAFKLKSFPNISETFVVHSIVSAIDRGYDVTILVDKVNSLSNSSLPDLVQQYGLMEKVRLYTEPKGKINRIFRAFFILLIPGMPKYFNRLRSYRKKTTLSFLFKLAFYKKLRKTDSFHVHFADNLGPLMDLKKIGYLKSNFVVTFHGYDAHYFPSKIENPKYFRQFEETVDHITVNSGYLKNLLLTKGFLSDHINVIPVGIDTNQFSAPPKALPKNNWKLLNVGRLIPLKGQEQGIRAVKLLIDRGYNVSLTIVGAGPLKHSLSTLINSLGLENMVKLVGEKSQLAIKELLTNHHLFLMTSTLDEEGRREAFGLVSLEAQSMGVPVIGFDSGGFPETMLKDKTGLIVPDTDIKAMAEAIELCILQPEVWLEMSRCAPGFVVQNFSKEVISKQYHALYQNLMANMI